MASPKEVPLLPGHWLKGSIEQRRRDPLGLFNQLAALGSDVAQFRAYWIHVYCMLHPDAVKHVLIDNAQNYGKGVMLEVLKPLLGHGLFTAEGELWKRNRRLAQPAFHREKLASLVDMMADATSKVLDRWEARAAKGEAFDVMPDMMALTMSVVARALFSADVTGEAAEVGEALTFALHETNHRMLSFNPLGRLLPTERNRAFKKAIATLDGVVLRVIEERRRSGEHKDDLLSLLMDAKDVETGESMSDRQLRDEAMTLFLAGHETTAVALSWLWYLVGTHPEIEARLRQELDAVLGGRTPRAADLQQLKVVSRVFDETLRLYPPAWVFGRESLGDDEILGFRIPKGQIVTISPWVLHRSPRFWDHPELFDPDRFLPERAANRPRHAYLPFGAGQRMCIGNHFAMMEAAVIVSMAMQRFRITIPAGHRAVPDPQVTLRPKGGMPVRLEKLRAPLARAV